MKKISVIVPVYNSEEELGRCLDSILNQTYKNLEIILINDGSTDNSLDVCETYAEQHSNIKVFTQDNQGQSGARNRGLEIASGDIIGFVDSDDVIHHEMYEYLLTMMKNYQADISSVQIETVNQITDIQALNQDSGTVEVVEKGNLLVDYMYDGLHKKAGQYHAGRKLFRRHTLEKVRFLEGRINEDILFNYEALEHANRLVKSERVMYYYLQDSESTTRRSFSEKELDLLFICDLLIEKAKKENNQSLIELAEMKKARSYFSLLAKIAYFGTNIETSKLEQIKKNLIRGLRDNMPLLMKSPIPVNRKLIMVAFAANFNLTSRLMNVIRK